MLVRLALSAILLAFASTAMAETRTFTLYVDKKPSGSHEVVVQQRGDGSLAVSSKADVTVKVAFITYHYVFQANEVWKDGKLLQFSSATDDNGKKHTLTVETKGDGLAVNADGKAARLDGAYTITNYWTMPAAARNSKQADVRLIDADTGKLLAGKLENLGIEKVDYRGRPIECVHVRIRGGVEVDLWYDGSDRLVRQESVEEGHRTLLELTNFKKD